jgi:hypothetical protein
MKSPFPGMDPYLEDPAFWPDFHTRFITYCSDYISDRLPEHYEARLDERLSVLEPIADQPATVIPDVTVSGTGARKPGILQTETASTATLEPVTIPLPEVFEDEVRESYIRIVRRPDRELVTVIELLSPSNKTGAGRELYLAKRTALIFQDVNLVELDLLRTGQRLPLSRPLPVGDYFALVARADRRPQCDVYAWTLRHLLPTIPIPLRVPDADIALNMAELVATTFERGRYARSLKYGENPVGNLGDEDLSWVRDQLSAPRSG